MRLKLFDIGGRDGAPAQVHERVLTFANLLTALRLACLPLFAWLALGAERLGVALVVLVAAASTDWVDGYVARRFDQVSRLGRFLDPLVDRLLLATAAVTLVLAGVAPWWLAVAVVARDLLVLVTALAMLGRIPEIAVTRTGKTATAALLAALPILTLAALDWGGAEASWAAGWALAAVGLAAYYAAGGQYARRFARERAGNRAPAPPS